MAIRKGEKGIEQKLEKVIGIWRERSVLSSALLDTISHSLSKQDTTPSVPTRSGSRAGLEKHSEFQIEEITTALQSDAREAAKDAALASSVKGSAGIIAEIGENDIRGNTTNIIGKSQRGLTLGCCLPV